MKITNVRSWRVKVPWDNNPGTDEVRDPGERGFLFVQIETDEGITGWGEVTTYPGVIANRAVSAYIDAIGTLLIGDNPSNIEAIWNKVFRELTYVGTRGATTAAVSGIDIALWDIRGKELGLPIYELLGGAVRDRIALYCHPYNPTSPEAIVTATREIVDSGFKAFKLDPMLAHLHVDHTAYIDGEISPEVEALAIDTLAAAREEAGDAIEIMIDAHAMYNVPSAIRLANKMAEYNIHWFEEPVPVESWKALQQVRERVKTPICVGERLHTRWEFVPIFENGLADYIMPDVTWTGGISELKKIATMAEAYYIPISPHDASGPVNVMAGAQVMMTVPNFYKLEVNRYDLSGYNLMIDEPLDIRDGCLYVSDRPGLGVNFKLDVLQQYEATPENSAKG